MAIDIQEALTNEEDIVTELENSYHDIFNRMIEIGDDAERLAQGIKWLQERKQHRIGTTLAKIEIDRLAEVSDCGEETYYRLLYMLCRMYSLPHPLNFFSNSSISSTDSIRISHYISMKKRTAVAPSVTMDSCITFLKSLQKEMETMKKENKKLMQENADLKADVKDLKDGLAEANKMMKKVKTEDEFVVRIVELAKENCVGSPDDAKPYATMLKELGRSKEATELRQWIKEEKKAMQQVNIEKVNDIHDNDNVTAKLM